jgi:vancomycin permeability regulator SanA
MGRAELIVVFGAAVGSAGPCPELRARLDRAAELYREGAAPRIRVSGGRTGELSEARAMRDYLLARGVAAEALELDERGSSTRRTIAALPRGARVIAVSSPYHMPRIRFEARRRGVDCTPAPAPDVRARPRQHAREMAALCWYAVTAR